VRFSSIILSSDSYLVSVARMKTHDRTIVTLSLKNIVFGAPIKDVGLPLEKTARRVSGVTIDCNTEEDTKEFITICMTCTPPSPHLAVIDGFEGMEGNGPSNGTPSTTGSV